MQRGISHDDIHISRSSTLLNTEQIDEMSFLQYYQKEWICVELRGPSAHP
jgi:hypothetical protein